VQRHRIKDLRDVIMTDRVSFPEKITRLGEELAQHYHDPVFAKSKTMGEIIERSLKRLLVDSLR
jgi:HEPN domain-containing protein